MTSLDVELADALPPIGPCCIDWYVIGQVHGIERVREQREAELAAIQREAARIVHRMAELDPWPEAQARTRIRTLEAPLKARGTAEPWPEEVGR